MKIEKQKTILDRDKITINKHAGNCYHCGMYIFPKQGFYRLHQRRKDIPKRKMTLFCVRCNNILFSNMSVDMGI